MSGLKVGDAAPDISLPDQDGKQVQLSTYWAEGPLVVFCYASDMSYGCTKVSAAGVEPARRDADH